MQVFRALLPVHYGIHAFGIFLGFRGNCKFHRSCSVFARELLQNETSGARCFFRIVLRVLACSPLYRIMARGGILKILQ